MAEPTRVVNYDFMLQAVKNPDITIVDVRGRDETQKSGMIPRSINIPLDELLDAFSMSHQDFEENYNHPKPVQADEIIFYCQLGKRGSEALKRALQLGYENAKVYLGSWSDWSSRQT